MDGQFQPDPAKTDAGRAQDLSFLQKRRTITVALFCLAAAFEVIFFILMLVFMDFRDKGSWFVFFAVLFVYCPLVTMTLRNAFKIDELFYRLVDELRHDSVTD